MKKNQKKISAIVMATFMGVNVTGISLVYAQEDTATIVEDTDSHEIESQENGNLSTNVTSSDGLSDTTNDSDVLQDENEKLNIEEDEKDASDQETNLDNLQARLSVVEQGMPHDLTVTTGTDGIEWTYDPSSNTLTFNQSGNYVVEGSGNETSETIVVSDGFVGTITLNNVNINASQVSKSAMEVKNSATLTVALKGSNTLTGGEAKAGLEFSGDGVGSLTITSSDNGQLVTNGGRNGAGIGGSLWESTQNITINGGIITAKGGDQAAGIGSGAGSSFVRNITINGGTVSAYGSGWSAGIGGGSGASVNNITINGGSVYAKGGFQSAGIGTSQTTNLTNVTITGGTVTADGNNDGSDDIGTGWNYGKGSTSNLTITGGSVKAVNKALGAVPTDGKGNNLYLAKIDNPSDESAVTIDNVTFTRNSNHPGSDTTFYAYVTGEDHTITINNVQRKLYWYESSNTFKLDNVKPIIRIKSIKSNSIVIESLSDTSKYGMAQYSLDGKNWSYSPYFYGLKDDSAYTIYARYLGNDYYIPSEAASVTVNTMKDGNNLINVPSDLSGTFGQTLIDISLPNGWYWTSDKELSIGKNTEFAYFSTSEYESEYDFSQVSGYDPDSHFVKCEVEVMVSKGIPSYEIPKGLILKQGDCLQDLVLPEGFSWKDASTVADQLGYTVFKAIYTPEDTTNYEMVTVDIPVQVVPATMTINHVPVIQATDKTLTVGDFFDAKAGVTATDHEDDDLTDQIQIVENTVDTTKVGEYKVTYEVEDSQGAHATKTIKVTVKAETEENLSTQGQGNTDTTTAPGPDKNDQSTQNDSDKEVENGTQTSIRTNIIAWSLAMGMAMLGFIGLAKKKHNK